MILRHKIHSFWFIFNANINFGFLSFKSFFSFLGMCGMTYSQTPVSSSLDSFELVNEGADEIADVRIKIFLMFII